MIAVLQRVSRASVTADGVFCGEIGRGLVVLLGVAQGDTEADAEKLSRKIAGCRIFPDEDGRMNRSVTDVTGGILVVSNFTLLANYAHGNRPDFFGAAAPDVAQPLYEKFLSFLRPSFSAFACGVFGADMEIDMKADGPVTLVMDSRVLSAGGTK